MHFHEPWEETSKVIDMEGRDGWWCGGEDEEEIPMHAVRGTRELGETGRRGERGSGVCRCVYTWVKIEDNRWSCKFSTIQVHI
jgi:hypothetical protein